MPQSRTCLMCTIHHDTNGVVQRYDILSDQVIPVFNLKFIGPGNYTYIYPRIPFATAR